MSFARQLIQELERKAFTEKSKPERKSRAKTGRKTRQIDKSYSLSGRYWTKDEDSRLARMSQVLTCKEISERTGRSVSAIKMRAFHLGISLMVIAPGVVGSKKHAWTIVEDWAVARYYSPKAVDIIAAALGLDAGRVRSRRAYLVSTKKMRHLELVPAPNGKDLVLAYCNKKHITLP